MSSGSSSGLPTTSLGHQHYVSIVCDSVRRCDASLVIVNGLPSPCDCRPRPLIAFATIVIRSHLAHKQHRYGAYRGRCLRPCLGEEGWQAAGISHGGRCYGLGSQFLATAWKAVAGRAAHRPWCKEFVVGVYTIGSRLSCLQRHRPIRALCIMKSYKLEICNLEKAPSAGQPERSSVALLGNGS